MLSTYPQASRSGEAAWDESIRGLMAGLTAAPESSKRTNLAGIDLVSLRLVALCAETQSLSMAARYLNMSLSCASHRLSHLEQLFRTRFFDRGYQGLRLTGAGRMFVLHIRVSLDIIRSCRDRIDLLPAEAANRISGNSEIAMGVEK